MNVGFIGTGNMASAFIGGLMREGTLSEDHLFVSDTSNDALEKVTEQFPQIHTSTDNLAFLDKLDFLVLSVKPYVYPLVINEIKDSLKESTVIITIAAGQTLAKVSSYFERPVKLVRTMPNTPALVGEGITAVCPGENLSFEEVEQVLQILGALGKTELLSESLFDGFTALCGSSPAYIFMLIEAMADGAVKEGIPRQKAYKMASQAVLGSAKMVLETKNHPALLKDQVCSPGGSTIEALISLEKSGFSASILDAIEVCAKKSKQMSGES